MQANSKRSEPQRSTPSDPVLTRALQQRCCCQTQQATAQPAQQRGQPSKPRPAARRATPAPAAAGEPPRSTPGPARRQRGAPALPPLRWAASCWGRGWPGRPLAGAARAAHSPPCGTAGRAGQAALLKRLAEWAAAKQHSHRHGSRSEHCGHRSISALRSSPHQWQYGQRQFIMLPLLLETGTATSRSSGPAAVQQHWPSVAAREQLESTWAAVPDGSIALAAAGSSSQA